MTTRALYLVCNSLADQSILQLLTSKCDEVQVISTVAQAPALLGAYSGTLDESGHAFGIILADVAAGGIALAEYICNYYNSLRTSGEQFDELQAACERPALILLDDTGDVNAARKALRLRVDGYVLKGERDEDRLSAIEQIEQALALREQRCARVQREVAPASSTVATNPQTPIGGGVSAQTAEFQLSSDKALSRLSQLESAIVNCLSAHMGFPMSAKSIVHAVMGRDLDDEKAASLIRPHISRLRSKVEPMPQMPQRLLTVRGKGYMFVC
jgi:DNA-binding response OmpR family regulator